MTSLGRKVVALLLLLLAVGSTCFAQQTITVPEDYPTIQAAIDAASEGAIIHIAEGTWRENLKINKSLTLQGEGFDQSVILAKKEDLPVAQIVGESQTSSISVVLENLMVTGSQDTGLLAKGNVRLTLRHVQVWRNGSDGVHLYDTVKLTVKESTIYKNQGSGLVLEGNAQVAAEGCTINKNNYYGVELWFSSEARIVKSAILENQDGIWLRDTARVSIKDCTIQKNEIGINEWGETQATIRDSLVCENATGIALDGSGPSEVKNCTITENSVYGISISGSGGSIFVENNAIKGNAGVGIEAYTVRVVHGKGNIMFSNAIDLIGNLPGSLREPLEKPTEHEIIYPNKHYSTLQHAVDALLPGGKLILRSGEYEEGLTIYKPIELIAQEKGKAVLKREDPYICVLSLVGGAKLTAFGLKVTAKIELGADAEATIKSCNISAIFSLMGTAQAEIIDSSITRGSISLTQSAKARFINCVISEGYTALSVSDISEVIVKNTTLCDNKNGIWLNDDANVIIIGSEIYQNYNQGVTSERTSSRSKLKVEDSYINKNGIGLSLGGGTKVQLSNCLISDNEHGLVASTEVTIINSRVTKNSRYGLWYSGDTRSTIKGSVIANNGFGGMAVWDTAKVAVINSTISTNSDSGIEILDSAHVDMKDCTVNGNSLYGVWIRGSGQLVVANSEIADNSTGIALWEFAQADIKGCALSQNRVAGVWSCNRAKTLLTNCKISHNLDGIVLWGKSASTLIGNLMLGNKRYAIALGQAPCFETTQFFRGSIEGRQNVIVKNDDKFDGNELCPLKLAFLISDTGGKYKSQF